MPALRCRLAALEACSGSPLTLLELEGAVPLSGAVAEAVAAHCPRLSSLALDLWQLSRPSDVVTEYDYGCGQLLTLCGPRLYGLCLVGVNHWNALSYMALRRCTALKELELDVGADPAGGLSERYLGRYHNAKRLAGHAGSERLHGPRASNCWAAVRALHASSLAGPCTLHKESGLVDMHIWYSLLVNLAPGM